MRINLCLWRKAVGLLFWSCWYVSVFSQTVCPGIPDFTDLTAEWVVATTGMTDDPFFETGIVPERHQVVTEQGTDFYTGGRLKLLPPGETKVVRLGNPDFGGEAESITYHFIVDPDRALLLLKFAVVFQDPSHLSIYQPRFVVRIMDKEGALIDACAEYDVSARPDIDGFQSFDYYGTPVRWRDWTSVGLDMSVYAGQEVQVQFVTYDCTLLAHFGYAYFTATCISNRLNMENCHGQEFTVTAPEGFPVYEWQDGRSGNQTTWTKQEEDMDLSCRVTSATGCRFTLSAHITAAENTPPVPELYDTICQGDTYTKYNYKLPAQDEPGEFFYYNSYFNTENCGYAGTSVLHLKVWEKYYPLEAEICPGESYTAEGFSWITPSPGVYRDTLRYPSAVCSCDSVVALRLTVFPELSTVHPLEGEKRPCLGTLQYYSMSESWDEGSYTWQFPEGVVVLEGQGKPQVKVFVTDAAEAGQVNLVYGKEGCAAAIEPFLLTPQRAYWVMLEDTVCTGLEYHEHGFDVPMQDTAGVCTFLNTYQAATGCDSLVTLRLQVDETPRVEVLVSDSIVCPGKEVKLQAIAGKGSAGAEIGIQIGDIYCSDGSFVKPAEYGASGKSGVGVVFYVDDSEEHGWIVHKFNQHTGINWATLAIHITGVPEIKDRKQAVADTAGYMHTFYIQETAGSDVFPVFYKVNFSEGWYVPALGQLIRLYAYIPQVNTSLELIGGHKFVFPVSGSKHDRWYYWSSTVYDGYNAWALNTGGSGIYAGKGYGFMLRSVRSF